MIKRLFDLFFSVMVLIVLFPIFLIVALGVKVTSYGPIFYKSPRVGLNGLVFTMYKFRTMHVSNKKLSECVITAYDDVRVFPFGQLLRTLKIDEIPQFWNIFIGQMSVIGPRPEDPKIVASHYTEEYRKTLQVKPGLASPGSIFYYIYGDNILQNSPKTSSEDIYVTEILPQKMQLELSYVENSSFLLDIKIIFQTMRVIFLILIGKKQVLLSEEYK